MSPEKLPARIQGLRVHMVGIKGTGMTALAEILAWKGARLTGSDVGEKFYTDAILESLGLLVSSPFKAENIPSNADLVIRSPAYQIESNPELKEATRRALPILSYPEALGALSRLADSSGIAGVHGKTTTTAIVGTILKHLAFPATVLAASAVSNFGGRSTIILGDEYFIAETCEYRNHFLNFSPSRIVLTSVEPDHQDFFPSYSDILAAFVNYARRLPETGELVFCADDPGACEAADIVSKERKDIRLIPYGEKADSPFRLLDYRVRREKAYFSLSGFDDGFELLIPGKHIALDAAGAICLVCSIVSKKYGSVSRERLESIRAGLASFSGSKRRFERIGEEGGILVMDDYGHHPTAIRKTIAGLKDFYPSRRIVVDFMSHTYSRTKALLNEFAESLDDADEVILHEIYASARETNDGSLTGRTLYDKVRERREKVSYFDKPQDALPYLLRSLRNGDLLLTMGAGNNFVLGPALLLALKERREPQR